MQIRKNEKLHAWVKFIWSIWTFPPPSLQNILYIKQTNRCVYI